MLPSQTAQGSLLRGITLGPARLVRFRDTCSLLTWLLHGSLAKGEPCQVSAEFWVGYVPDAVAGGLPSPAAGLCHRMAGLCQESTPCMNALHALALRDAGRGRCCSIP